jgi:hypothetical protein
MVEKSRMVKHQASSKTLHGQKPSMVVKPRMVETLSMVEKPSMVKK